MRAVNLIPADQRRAAGAAGRAAAASTSCSARSRSSSLCVAALTISNKQVADRKAEADRLETQAAAAAGEGRQPRAYKTFNAARDDAHRRRAERSPRRASTGATTLDQVSRVIPADVSLHAARRRAPRPARAPAAS